MYTGLHLKYPFFLFDFNETCIFARFPKITQMSNFMKIRQVGAELFHADRKVDSQTDRHDKANSRYPQFCERA